MAMVLTSSELQDRLILYVLLVSLFEYYICSFCVFNSNSNAFYLLPGFENAVTGIGQYLDSRESGTFSLACLNLLLIIYSLQDQHKDNERISWCSLNESYIKQSLK